MHAGYIAVLFAYDLVEFMNFRVVLLSFTWLVTLLVRCWLLVASLIW